jgi:hypothetical protein
MADEARHVGVGSIQALSSRHSSYCTHRHSKRCQTRLIDLCSPCPRTTPDEPSPLYPHSHTREPVGRTRDIEGAILETRLDRIPFVVGQLKESTGVQALQEILDHLDLLRLLVAGVRAPAPSQSRGEIGA